ncbi:MAG: aminoglycoside phosphotransferase family protein [Bacteroidales bacterium]|nr:aminoglycoside phosphotransferase family protein [Bacteroidales bacterium]
MFMQVLELIPTRTGELFHTDNDGNFWRMYFHIPGSRCYDRIDNPELAYEGGRAFGQFQALTAGIDPGTLAITIPRFHDIAWRLEQFDEAIGQDIADRVSRIPDEIRFVRERAQEMHTIQRLVENGQLPVRVTHNDTKFNNILFDSNAKAICIVDLDTVMPGTVLYDFGDAIRTGANTADEDEPDVSKVGIDLRLFEAYARGFLETAGASLTPVELDHLTFSAKFMTYIIGLRFLTDHINGDTYYKIHHPGHNLQRARCQFRLLSEMEKQTGNMERIIKAVPM